MSIIQSFRLLLAMFLLFAFSSLTGQNLTVSLNAPGQASRCGPFITVNGTVANNTAFEFRDVTGAFDIPDGVFLESVIPAVLEANGDFDFDVVAAGTSVSFTATFQVGCNVRTATFPFTFETEGTYTVTTDDGMGNITMEDFTVDADGSTASVEVVAADLSMPSSSPSVLGVYVGLIDDVEVQVVNNSFGELTEFTYCVINSLPNLALQAITIPGVNGAADVEEHPTRDLRSICRRIERGVLWL